MNPVPSMRIFTATSGKKCPSNAPAAIASKTQNVRLDKIFFNRTGCVL